MQAIEPNVDPITIAAIEKAALNPQLAPPVGCVYHGALFDDYCIAGMVLHEAGVSDEVLAQMESRAVDWDENSKVVQEAGFHTPTLLYAQDFWDSSWPDNADHIAKVMPNLYKARYSE